MTNDKGKYSQYLTVAGSYFANKGWVHLLLAGGLYILYKMFFRTSLPFFLTISSLPLMTAIFLLIIKYSKQSFYTLFTLQFLLAAAYAVTICLAASNAPLTALAQEETGKTEMSKEE